LDYKERYLSLYIRKDKFSDTVFRETYTFFDCLTDLGGFRYSLILLGGVIAEFISEKVMKTSMIK